MKKLKQKLQKLSEVVVGITSAVTLFLLNTQTAWADPAAKDPFEKVTADAGNLTSKIQGGTLILCAVAIAGTGLVYALGPKGAKKWIRSYWGGMLVGVIAVFIGGNILAWGLNYFGMK